MIDGKISIDEAREIITWIREHAGLVLEEAERMLQDRSLGAEIGRSAMTGGASDQVGMKGLAIGTVWCQVRAGSFAIVNIVLDREGRLVTQREPGLPRSPPPP